MDFALTEEQNELRELARKILEDRATDARLREIARSDERIDRELWRELARANLLGVAVAEQYGGSDFGLLALYVLLEEIGRAVAPVPAVATLVLGALPIAQFGSAEQKQRLLPGVVEGERFLTAALAEDGVEGPVAAATSARRDGGGWRLDGTCICVPNAHVAERILVPARTGEGEVGVFLLDPRARGVELVPQETTNGEPHFQLALDGAAVEATDLLGELARGAEIASWLAARATLALCALQLGISDRALQMTAEYTRTRKQFDRPIGSFQAVHQRAADAYIHVEAMRLSLWQAAFRLDRGELAAREVAVAKYWAAEGGQYVGYAAQHLHGGIGVDIDYPLHRYYIWAKQVELTLGSAAQQLARIGAGLAEEPVNPEG